MTRRKRWILSAIIIVVVYLIIDILASQYNQKNISKQLYPPFRVAFTYILGISLGVFCWARPTKRQWIMIASFMVMWAIGASLWGHHQVTSGALYNPITRLEYAGPWYPFHYLFFQTTNPAFWSIIQSAVFWIIVLGYVSAILDGLWSRMNQKRQSTIDRA